MKNKLFFSIFLCLIGIRAMGGVFKGNIYLCEGGTSSAITGSPSGGSWSSGNTSVATTGPGASTTVTAGTAGFTNVTYSLTGDWYEVRVYAMPAAITGPSSVCINASITLGETVTGGTWFSNLGTTASITSGGVVTGIVAGTAYISYTLSSTQDGTPKSCAVVKPITVNNIPVSILPSPATVCIGSTIRLSDHANGNTTEHGSFTESSSLITTPDNGNFSASPGTYTVAVTGVSAGTAVITYSLDNGCYVTSTINVGGNAITSTAGTFTTCVGSTINHLSCSPAGSWLSGNTGVATINSSTGIVTGVSGGTANITYTPTSGGCPSYTVVTINAAPASITGNTPVCVGGTLPLGETATDGTWSSDNTTVAMVDGSGLVTGASAGTANISYTNSCGAVGVQVTVNAIAPITGTKTVCIGSTTQLNDAAGAGTWSTTNGTGSITVDGTGLVTGVTGGTATVTFTIGGCSAMTTVTVNSTPEPTVLCSASSPHYGFFLAESISPVSVTYTVDINDGSTTVNAPDLSPLTLTSGPAVTYTDISQIDVPYTASWTITKIYGVSISYGGCTWALSCNASRPSAGGTHTATQGQDITAPLSATPNPNNGTFTVNGVFKAGSSKEAKIVVEDMVGKVIYTDVAAIDNGGINKVITLGDNVANGIYLIKVHSGSTSKVMRISVNR